LHEAISAESAWNRTKNIILEPISAKSYGLWNYNSIFLQGRKEHMGSEGRILSKSAGV